MNYGKFFRLNQNVSKIEVGVTIFDYIDMPAYFESSRSNKMSPKYPISVTLTEDSVLFRVHYSSFKTDKSYLYDVREAYSDNNDNSSLNHMEEIILKLPYANDSVDNLSNIIKEIYNTRYPLLTGANTSFIKELIIKRYGYGVETSQDNSTTQKLYDKLRVNLDKDFSYSTLWLMDIVKSGNIVGTEENKNIYLFDNGGKSIVKFLRKLLLDFMFDLQHSDVFQTSKYYQTMYSGLMSNFYFSALMHKCEYYFYRGLINDVIQKRVSSEDTRKKHIRNLYAEKLALAENLWIQDIMDSRSDKFFEYDCPKTFWGNIKKEWNRNKFKNHESWFAEPEEELRRVCFTMKDDDDIPHICNVDTLTEYISDRKAKKEIEEIRTIRDNNRIVISQWFLKRYNFSDVVHFHLFRHANLVFVISSLALLLFIIMDPHAILSIDNLIESITTKKKLEISLPSLGWCEGILLLGSFVTLIICAKECKLVHHLKNKFSTSILYKTRLKLTWKRIFAWFGIQLLAFSLIILGLHYKIAFLFLAVIILCIIRSLISNLHLLYPRLIASIVTAWLTLAAGNDLFAAFFDSIISPIMIICLSVIVFIFVLYEINRIIPLETTVNKLYRSLELTIISYTISLIVGAVVINFTGERILERSGVLEGFYADYVSHNDERKVEDMTYEINSNMIPKLLVNKLTDKERVEYLKKIRIKKNTDNSFYPIATEIPILGTKYTFFFLRDFWIQFSFVAMFIGIFIQMIFEEKRITEF